MKAVDTQCKECGSIQEDLIGHLDTDHDLDPCKNCGSSSMEVMTGVIVASSSQKAPNPGSGPWN